MKGFDNLLMYVLGYGLMVKEKRTDTEWKGLTAWFTQVINSFRGRVEHSRRYIVFSGGHVADPMLSEAESMKAYALENKLLFKNQLYHSGIDDHPFNTTAGVLGALLRARLIWNVSMRKESVKLVIVCDKVRLPAVRATLFWLRFGTGVWCRPQIGVEVIAFERADIHVNSQPVRQWFKALLYALPLVGWFLIERDLLESKARFDGQRAIRQADWEEDQDSAAPESAS